MSKKNETVLTITRKKVEEEGILIGEGVTRKVYELNGKIYKICCGGLHTLALSTMGTVFSWGCNDDHSLGRPGEDKVPLKISAIDIPVTDISCGDSHSVAYNNDLNVLFLWGSYRVRK